MITLSTLCLHYRVNICQIAVLGTASLNRIYFSSHGFAILNEEVLASCYQTVAVERISRLNAIVRLRRDCFGDFISKFIEVSKYVNIVFVAL